VETAVRDLYDILEVPNNASEAWIKRAYELKKKAAIADAKMSDAERDALLKDLDKAYGVLSNPAKRELYDNPDKLRRSSMASASTIKSETVIPWRLVAAVAGLLLIGLSHYVYTGYEEKKQRRLEAERVDAMNARQAQLAAEHKQRMLEAEQARQEKKEQNAQTLADRQFRDAVGRQQRTIGYTEREDANRAAREEREAEYAAREQARRDSSQGDSYERRQAQNEVERQKRWVESRQREEQQAASDRAARAQAERNRLEWEERYKR
jgi:curved DNA-binding protein CbpA